jgi:hypothetical protein
MELESCYLKSFILQLIFLYMRSVGNFAPSRYLYILLLTSLSLRAYNQTYSNGEYYQMFYNDTAIYGNPKALECAHAFFGADRLLFGCDFPLGDRELWK